MEDVRYLCEHTDAILDLFDVQSVLRKHRKEMGFLSKAYSGDIDKYLREEAPKWYNIAHVLPVYSPPIGDGQQMDSGGDLAQLPNELLAMVAVRLWPTRTLFELSWTCQLLRDNALSDYVAHGRYGDGKGWFAQHYRAALNESA